MQKKRYKVDYGGQKNFLAGAKDYYNAGERVRVCYNFIATDTRYFFFVDGAPFNPGFNDKEGFIIEFIKNDQSEFEAGWILNMGQILSIPFIILGIWLIVRAYKKPIICNTKEQQ